MDRLTDVTFTWLLFIGLISSYVLYFVFRKTEELSKNAAENTLATVYIAVINIVVIVLFVGDANAWVQAFYVSLNIPTLPAATWDGVPVWLLAILAVVFRDFADYWSHRLMHTRWGWPTHAAHHSDTHVNAFSLLRIHVLEHMLMVLSYVVLLTWLQMPGAIPGVTIFSTLLGMYVHMDLDIDHGPFRFVLASPRFHRWHHADVPEAYGKNLANVIPFYDWLFGTYITIRVLAPRQWGLCRMGLKIRTRLEYISTLFRNGGG